MGRKFKDMQTAEQRYQAEREQAWRAENEQALNTRAGLRAYGAGRAELDHHVPLTPRPEPVAPATPKKKRRWLR